MSFPTNRLAFITGTSLALGGALIIFAVNARAQGKSSGWVASWATAVTAAESTGSSHNGFNNESYREIVHLSVGGDQFRVRLTNIYGTQTVTVGHATVASPDTSTPSLQDIIPSTLHDLTFNGQSSATILAGDELYSDPIDVAVGDGADLVITLYFPNPTGPATWHASSRQSNFAGPGDLASSTNSGFTIVRASWMFLSGVDVLRHQEAGAVAVFGDSISEGNGSTLNANKRWPDLLAKRLLAQHGKAPSVVNVSLAGSRLNHEGPEPGAGGFPGFVQLGPNAGARINEDIFPQVGASTVVLQLGIDDIWMNDDSADAITTSLLKIAGQLQQRGLAVIVSTITPFSGFETSLPGAWTPERDATRNAVNAFIRGHQTFDGVVDFDQVLRDPADPSRLQPALDSGDHFHPNDAGNQMMADFFPLQLIR
jgi:lysophospholipase L1-like esterase